MPTPLGKVRYWLPLRDKDLLLIKDTTDMRYSDVNLLSSKPKWLLQSHSDLQRHEGFREFAYPDPLSKLGLKYKDRKWKWGYVAGDVLLAKYGESEADGRPWTVGYGFTRNVKPSHRISKVAADRMLEQVIVEHLPVLEKLIPEWKKMPLYVQTVLVNLAYNLGLEKLSKFAPTLAVFKAGNFKGAGQRLRNTAWFKQVGARGLELVARLETGRIEPQHAVVKGD